jgi:hypothetical protein
MTAAVEQVGTVDTKTNKPNGLLAENASILSEMQGALKSSPMPSKSIA